MIQQLIARYGEISLKGKNRSDFERILVRNMRHAVRDMPEVEFDRVDGRVMVSLNGADADEVTNRLRRVFGLLSLSPVRVVQREIEELVQAGAQVLGDYEQVESASRRLDRPFTFKIEAKRTDKRFPLPSPEIARQVG